MRPAGYLVLLFTLTLAAAGAPRTAAAQEEAAGAEAPRLPAVTVATAETREFLRRVPISGTLIPREEVLVFPEVSGHEILELNAEVGDRVQAGAVLARLNDRTLRSQAAQAEAELARADAGVRQSESQVASAQARLTQTNEALQRTQALVDRGTATQAALDQARAEQLTAEAALQSARDGVRVAEAQRQQAQASLDIARLNLENAEITAPAAGIVSARSGQVGAIASVSAEPLYRIIRDGALEVEAEVIETDLALVGPGDPAELEIAGLATLPGSVRLVSPVVDPQSRLGTVRIVPEAREGLRSGLFVGGWITAEQRQAVGVPATAVITDAEGDHVLLVVDGVLQRREVAAGLLWGDWREVVSGLQPGNEVVSRAGAFFAEGDAIRPIRDGGGAEPAAGAAAAEPAPEAAQPETGG